MKHYSPSRTNTMNCNIPNPNWLIAVFDAKASQRGGILRRAVRDVNREVGRDAFIQEVQRRGWHLIESGGQYVVFCNQGDFRILC
jgi:hypothetical protein